MIKLFTSVFLWIVKLGGKYAMYLPFKEGLQIYRGIYNRLAQIGSRVSAISRFKRCFSQEKITTVLNTSITFLVLLKIFLNPFPQITAIHELCFYLSVMILIFLLYRRETAFSLNSPFTGPLFLFLAWCIWGLLFALNLGNSIHDIYAHLLKYLVLFFLIINFLGNKQYLLVLIWTIIISTSIFSLWQLIPYYFIMGMPFSMKLKLGMPGEISTNVMGVLTVFAFVMALYLLKTTKKIYQTIVLILCTALLMITTLATQTRSAILAMSMVIVITFFKNKKIGLFLMIFLFAFIALMPAKNIITTDTFLDKIKSDDRISIWYAYWEIIKDHPLTGVGFGMQTVYNDAFLEIYNARVPAESRNPFVYYAPHNFIVDIATRTGIVGLMIFFYIIFSFFRIGWNLIRQKENPFVKGSATYLMIAFLAIFIQGLFENTMSGPAAIILYSILAMMTILWKLDRVSEGGFVEHPANI